MYVSEIVTVEQKQGYYVCDVCKERYTTKLEHCDYCGKDICNMCETKWNYDYDNLITLEPNMGDYPDSVCSECYELSIKEFKDRSLAVWDKIWEHHDEFDAIKEEFKNRVKQL